MASSTASGGIGGRRIGMRLWLGAAFAGVTLITAASVYVFVNDSSGRTLQSQAGDLAVGRTSSLADALAKAGKGEAADILAEANTDAFEAWAVSRHGEPFAPQANFDELAGIEQSGAAVQTALTGRRYKLGLPGDLNLTAAPIFGKARVRGVVIARAAPPPALTRAFDELRGDRLQALAIAIAIGLLVGFVVSSLISIRVKRLARSAERMAAGHFDMPVPAGGSDEIGDLTRSLDTMRRAMRDSFDMLATERDRLSAIFDGLTEAVIVVGEDGEVRFNNPAARRLVRNGRPATALIPSLHRAAEQGSDEIPVLSIDGRVYGVQARRVRAEHAVLMVVRDRTEELRRESRGAPRTTRTRASASSGASPTTPSG